MIIHKTALVHPDAVLADDVEIGPNTIISDKANIGPGVKIGANVIVSGSVEIGDKCQIFTGAVIGTEPQDLKYKGEETRVSIGKNTTIREYVTINRGTTSTGETRVGDNCLLMAYVHVAHDCIVGNNVVLANCATLAGHVVAEDKSIVGGLSAVHQFTRIGTMSIVGGGSRVSKDIPPFCKAAGTPIRMFGLNTVGLQRSNFSSSVREQLKRTYKTMFRSKMNTTQAIKYLEKNSDLCDEVKYFIAFIKESERGICKE
ncbi:MAG: acyl-ACP--UDP-N-acetylglucosamine O-acyltransferase [Elusimicrobiota bacterium]